jgi:hypothetical protein
MENFSGPKNTAQKLTQSLLRQTLKTVCLNFVSIHFCSVHASSDLSEKGHLCYKWGTIKTYYWKICTNTCLTRSTAAEANTSTVFLYKQRIKPYNMHIDLK